MVIKLLGIQIITATNAFEDLSFPGTGIVFKDILYSSLGKAYRKASACAEKAQREMADTYLCPEWDWNPLSQYCNGRC
jgi:hypothetical protein